MAATDRTHDTHVSVARTRAAEVAPLSRLLAMVLLVSLAIPSGALAQYRQVPTPGQGQRQQTAQAQGQTPQPAQPSPMARSQAPARLDLGRTVTQATLPVAGSVRLELLAEGLTAPVTLVEAPDGSGRLFVVDQVGLIWVIETDGTLRQQPFLDLRDRLVDLRESFDERGLLGLAFHPRFASTGRFFVYYSAPLRPGAPNNFNHTSHIAEFRVSADNRNQADPTSERIILRVDQPQFNHDGGTLAFGPQDGYLYISLGDGGAANDVGVGHVPDWYERNEGGNGQDITQNLLGSILRIDVDSGQPYAIPPDNPFVGQEGLDEIWAYGFRNPYRFSFDQGGELGLLVADAGQDLFEEVSVVRQGRNYGWNVREGLHCFDAAQPEQPPEQCPRRDPRGNRLIDPVIEYLNANQPGGIGLVVVGGYVYRGSALPNLQGQYIFGDWSTSFDEPNGKLFVARPQPQGVWEMRELLVPNTPTRRLGHFLLGFGQDADGELYVLTTDRGAPVGNTGKVFRMAPGPHQPGGVQAQPPPAPPRPTPAPQPRQQPQAQQPPAQQRTQVVMRNISYEPQQITVRAGTTVEWVHRDGSIPHTVTAGNPGTETGLFDSGLMRAGDRFSFTFEQSGTYEYFCTVHPRIMQGTVVVTP